MNCDTIQYCSTSSGNQAVVKSTLVGSRSNRMKVRVFETDDLNSEPSASLGHLRDVDLGQQGSSPEQVVQGLSSQFLGLRLFAFNNQDPELLGWEEITVANAANLPAFLAHRRQLKAVRSMKAPHQDFEHAVACWCSYVWSQQVKVQVRPFEHCFPHTLILAKQHCRLQRGTAQLPVLRVLVISDVLLDATGSPQLRLASPCFALSLAANNVKAFHLGFVSIWPVPHCTVDIQL